MAMFSRLRAFLQPYKLHMIVGHLDQLMVGKTALVIAHRLSTIRHADNIAVLDEGRIVEMGNHDELMAHGTVYRRLVERQFALASTAGA